MKKSKLARLLILISDAISCIYTGHYKKNGDIGNHEMKENQLIFKNNLIQLTCYWQSWQSLIF
jgi:hypothetical protein